MYETQYRKAVPQWLKITLLVAVVIAVAALAVVGIIALGKWQGSRFLPAGSDDQAPGQSSVPTGTLPPPSRNIYGAEDFEYVDGYLTCTAGPYMMGIDVSTYQGEIDWEKVRDAGVEFVIIRAGGRGWGQEGKLYKDKRAQKYYEGAKAVGLMVGTYFFSQAITVEEAREEARYTLEIVKDWELDMPIVYDWEYVSKTARTADLDARGVTDCTIAFCEEIKAAGKQPMVYSNPSQTMNKLFLRELTQYPFWLAMYDAPMRFPYAIDMWQYTCTGKIPGIKGNVDINLLLPK